MIDVVYCPGCKQFSKGKWDIEGEEYFEDPCPTCPRDGALSNRYVFHVDEDGNPLLYEIVCGEDLPMYDTYMMVSESIEDMKDKIKILKQAIKLSKLWTKEAEKARIEEERLRRAKELVRLSDQKLSTFDEMARLDEELTKNRGNQEVLNDLLPVKSFGRVKRYEMTPECYAQINVEMEQRKQRRQVLNSLMITIDEQIKRLEGNNEK